MSAIFCLRFSSMQTLLSSALTINLIYSVARKEGLKTLLYLTSAATNGFHYVHFCSLVEVLCDDHLLN